MQCLLLPDLAFFFLGDWHYYVVSSVCSIVVDDYSDVLLPTPSFMDGPLVFVSTDATRFYCVRFQSEFFFVYILGVSKRRIEFWAPSHVFDLVGVTTSPVWESEDRYGD